MNFNKNQKLDVFSGAVQNFLDQKLHQKKFVKLKAIGLRVASHQCQQQNCYS